MFPFSEMFVVVGQVETSPDYPEKFYMLVQHHLVK